MQKFAQNIRLLVATTLLITGLAAYAGGPTHDHHVNHGMVLFGDGPIYLDHIVYTSPHNYQVLLQVEFSDNVRDLYLKVKHQNPAASFKFKSDPIDLKDIPQMSSLHGDIFLFTGEEVIKGVEAKITKILYFDELPF